MVQGVVDVNTSSTQRPTSPARGAPCYIINKALATELRRYNPIEARKTKKFNYDTTNLAEVANPISRLIRNHLIEYSNFISIK